MKKLVIIILIIFVPITSIALDLNKTSKVTIFVVGEDGEPINGANVSVSFETKEPSKVSTIKGSTDKEGRFSATNSAFLGKIYFGALSEGYYKSVGEYQFKDSGFSHWKPWNHELKVVLRKIEKPLPMYARNTRYKKLEIPKVGEKIGFDLLKFDWVVPYGQGITSDFLFKLDKEFIGDDNYKASLSLSFSNNFDGIQLVKENLKYGSEFKMHRLAPENGFQKELKLQISRSPGEWVKLSSQNDDNYIFRIRSEEKNGKLLKGMYGKIHGPIEFFPHASNTAIIIFKYYLNPDYTRNLEFDPKRNLFGNLPDLERVTEP